jgi:ribosomal protein S18 acetylase RimI-like enzyme
VPKRSKDSLQILPARSAHEILAARQLFEEYATLIGIDLSFQGFDEELRTLPGRYAPPAGELLLARHKEDWVGCAGLRDLGEGIAEMKRLFVRPEFRALGVGRMLADSVIDAARRRSYRVMRLDTAPWMDRAIGLYSALGFREIGPYYRNPVAGARFFELSLTP